ncbi:MAG: hypothetical protein D6705_13725 [Deltaproteobacteria bacterium]|nr:MAG: hypothetical protein D6705_13725 [Deltaproteobacteria bacterium]
MLRDGGAALTGRTVLFTETRATKTDGRGAIGEPSNPERLSERGDASFTILQSIDRNVSPRFATSRIARRGSGPTTPVSVLNTA